MPVSPEETATAVKKAKAELAKAKSKEQVIEVWKEHYGTLGHKALGRMLVGTYDDFVARKQAKEKGS